MANTNKKPHKVHEWERLDSPVMSIDDEGASWWENMTIYKSSVIWDKDNTTDSPFVMFYNAKGQNPPEHGQAERIGMAVSDDMVNWKRYEGNPVLDHQRGITGDAYIQKIGDVWVMFYFGAFLYTSSSVSELVYDETRAWIAAFASVEQYSPVPWSMKAWHSLPAPFAPLSHIIEGTP